LVPLDASTLLHRGVLDRDYLVEPAAGDDEAPHMLGEMARKADQLARQRQHLGEMWIGGVEAGATRRLVLNRLSRGAPQHAGERPDGVVRQSKCFADLTDGAAGTVGDHGGGKARTVTAVALIDVLDDLLTPLVLEIDIDIGRLASFRRDEALE